MQNDNLTSSPQQENYAYNNKNGLTKKLNMKTLIVLAGIMVLILITAATAMYLNMGNAKSQQKSVNTPRVNTITSTPVPTSSSFNDNDVSVVSDIPGYTLSVQNKNTLVAYLNTTGIWGSTFNQLADPVTVKQMNIHLTNTEGTINVDKNEQGQILFSSNYIFQDSAFNLYIYLSPLALNSTDSSKLFQQAVINNTYKFGTPDSANPPAYSSLNVNGKLLFNISKR